MRGYSFQPWYGPNFPTSILILCVPHLTRIGQSVVLGHCDRELAAAQATSCVRTMCEWLMRNGTFHMANGHFRVSDFNEFALRGEIGVRPVDAPEAEVMHFDVWYELSDGLNVRNVKLTDVRL